MKSTKQVVSSSADLINANFCSVSGHHITRFITYIGDKDTSHNEAFCIQCGKYLDEIRGNA